MDRGNITVDRADLLIKAANRHRNAQAAEIARLEELVAAGKKAVAATMESADELIDREHADARAEGWRLACDEMECWAKRKHAQEHIGEHRYLDAALEAEKLRCQGPPE